ncbi:MAG: adenosylcobinamide amidohydrolase [Proteobacteria bacterium]|nr:adenosylcobinamide amidohydrolase [Pseudomonadota bacterium]
MDQAVGLDVSCEPPWLQVDLGAPHRCLGWAVHRPGRVVARHVVWLQVDEAELAPGVDPAALLGARLAARGLARAVGLMTARRVSAWEAGRAVVGDVGVDTVLTLGLSNAVHVAGEAGPQPWRPGTINLLARLSVPLTDAALVEAVSIAAEARTAALLETAGPAGSPLTGTGTDCIVIAVPPGPGRPYAGLHTATGQALGRAVYDTTRRAALAWQAQR